jgi:transcriptional regulator with XRE-family HTH domain
MSTALHDSVSTTLHTLDHLSPIEFLRRNAGLKQWQVEMATGLPRGSLSKFERGSQWPWPDARQRLARFFECDEEDLFG